MPVLPLSEIPSPLIHRVHGYWQGKRGAGEAIPARAAIDPAEMVDFLPNLSLVEAVDGRWRYRLIGTRINEFVGRDSTGRYVDEVHLDGETPAWRPRYARVFAGEILCGRDVMHWVDRPFIPFYWIGLPLRTPDGRIGQIITALDFQI